MFEKDAEEYANRKGHEHYNYLFEENAGSPADFARCCFKDGAEFGYNKANEWHKADVPTTPINKVVLGYIKDYNTKKFCLVKWNGEWWYDARTWDDKVKLIAWKEIVLPKEREFKSEIVPEITLPKGSAEFVDKAIADAEKHLRENE